MDRIDAIVMSLPSHVREVAVRHTAFLEKPEEMMACWIEPSETSALYAQKIIQCYDQEFDTLLMELGTYRTASGRRLTLVSFPNVLLLDYVDRMNFVKVGGRLREKPDDVAPLVLECFYFLLRYKYGHDHLTAQKKAFLTVFKDWHLNQRTKYNLKYWKELMGIAPGSMVEEEKTMPLTSVETAEYKEYIRSAYDSLPPCASTIPASLRRNEVIETVQKLRDEEKSLTFQSTEPEKVPVHASAFTNVLENFDYDIVIHAPHGCYYSY